MDSSSSLRTVRASHPEATSRSGFMPDQQQFLHVVDRDEAERRFQAPIDFTRRTVESVPIDAALGRVLATDVVSSVDVPSFDRSNVDGFAVIAEDTYSASEESPRRVRLRSEERRVGKDDNTGRALHA